MNRLIENKRVHIFDMDGTLVNLEEFNKCSYSSTLEKYFNMKLEDKEYQAYFSGTKTAKGFEFFLESKNIKNYNIEELIMDFRRKKEDILKNSFNMYVKLIPFAAEYLDSLKDQDKKVILATSSIKNFTLIILKNLGIYDYFDLILTAEDVKNGKPDPEIYNLAVLKSEFQKDQAVVYEDSLNGIISAKSANLICVGIHTLGLNDKAVKEADYIISDYSELLKN